MKQWKFNLLASIPLFFVWAIVGYLSGLGDILQIAGLLSFLLGFYAILSGLYYYHYQKDREFQGMNVQRRRDRA